MGIIVANLFITLDGVYQAPGGREEDLEGGFAYGGWQSPVSDDEAGAAIGEEIGRIDALLLGRKTYDIFAAY
ncbi:MAG: deaminase, partial [Pseudarthrobacter sp.]